MKTTLLLFILSGLLVAGCNKKEEQTSEFSLSYNNHRMQLPQNTPVNTPTDFYPDKIYTRSDEHFKMFNTRPELIQETKITKVQVGMPHPKTMQTDFLKSVTVYMSAAGLAEREIATIASVADSVSVIDLNITGDDVQEYLKQPEINLRAKVTTDKALPQNLEIEINVDFIVTAREAD